jgi:preprotein translocase subunit SecF
MIQFAPSSIAWLFAWLLLLAGLVWQAQSFRTKQRDIIGSMKSWFAVSVIFLVVASGSMAVKGLNYGLDFTGGTILEMAVYKQTSVADVQAALDGFKTPKLGEQVVQVGADMVPDEAGKPYQRVVLRVTREETGADGAKQLVNEEPKALYDHLQAKLGESKELRTASIGPTMTGELRNNAIMAVLVAMVAQAIYIFFRFGFQWKFGIAAVVAILHDVVIMVGLYSMAGRQIDSAFIAAILTVAGYSVMDSVVIFDRIRENINQHLDQDFAEVVNDSVNQTMTRSINTTMTVILTLLSIYFLGGSTLQNFAFSLLVGITSGAYSSIFIASPVLVLVDRWGSKAAAAKAAQAAAAPVGEQSGTEVSADGRRRRRQNPRKSTTTPQP